jgi:dienelactone hydrolase
MRQIERYGTSVASAAPEADLAPKPAGAQGTARAKATRRFGLIAICLILVTSQSSVADESWTLTRDLPLVSRWPTGGKIREEKITADLFRPTREGRAPAAVIINSSGGVTAHAELYYGRLLASNGVAALVVDSFAPRGVRRTTDDQSRVWQSQSDVDAAAGFHWLAAQPWVDATRIIVMGMSRGGSAALAAAIEADRRRLQTTDARFAAHVAIATGGCNFQNEDARTTGAPIFFMLAELDDYTPIRPCLEYADRMRAAGNPHVRLAVYPGVYHAFEGTGGIAEAHVEHGKRCSFFRNAEGRLTDRANGQAVPANRERRYVLEHCVDHGPVTIHGDQRVKAQATADLLQFLRDVGIVEDAEARAIVPDCSTLPEGIHRRNCVRARAGWTGDLVALGRAYRYPGGPRRDNGLAARLFRLAADRGHAQAQWELALMYREGAGVARDPTAARTLARVAAEAGEAPAMNTLGVMARDGVGQTRDDTEAVRWFRQAAELRHSYALTNLGQMYWAGRGGLAVDRAEAVRLWRQSAYYENPFGRLYLAEALEKGDGVARDTQEALELYRTVAAQDAEPAAKRRASDALARLGASAPR